MLEFFDSDVWLADVLSFEVAFPRVARFFGTTQILEAGPARTTGGLKKPTGEIARLPGRPDNRPHAEPVDRSGWPQTAVPGRLPTRRKVMFTPVHRSATDL